jgi:23S rRNA pseudouridine1911/1915/1917 synthase
VLVDGVPPLKSERVRSGSWLEIELPEAAAPVAVDAEPVPGLAVLHDDADIVVVDKPVGVAVHPSPGWTGPTVVGGLAGAGYRISTSGAAERQGVVHRIDV